jgi:hypothetical protein
MKIFDHYLTSSVVLKLIQGHEAALVLFDLLLLDGCREHLPLGVSASLIITNLLLICAATRWEKLLMFLVRLLGAILSTGAGTFGWSWCLL